jgi:hypothetical protein
MSLKDLLGFFDSDETKNQSNLDVSLHQGANFNSMQSRIESSVEPRLALIEQTTEPGFGSIIENFSGNSSEAPLVEVNTAEYKELQELEDNFNKAVSQYTQKQKSLMGGTEDAHSKGWSWNAIKNNIIWQGPKSPDKCSAACTADSSCTAWQTCNNGKAGRGCQGCYLINKPNISPPGREGPNWTSALVNRNPPGGARKELDTMFNALQSKATELQQKTMAFHSQRQKLISTDGQLTQQKSSTLNQLKDLQSQQSRLDKLTEEGDTLSAIVHDNTLQMNAAYMRYFIWLGAAITLGLVAAHRSTK